MDRKSTMIVDDCFVFARFILALHAGGGLKDAANTVADVAELQHRLSKAGGP